MIRTRLAHSIVLAWGWRRMLVAFLAGAFDGSGATADRVLAGAVHHFPDPDLADRRLGGRTVGRRISGRGRRLVVRLRLFRGRTLLDGQCAPGRCQDLRVAVAVCSHRAASAARVLHCFRHRACSPALDPWRHADPVARARAHAGGVAARASLQRLSLECLRLCAGDPVGRWRRAPRWSGSGA